MSLAVTPHAVARQRIARLAASTKPFVARGAGLIRCPDCRLAAGHCLCALRPAVQTRAGVCLLLGDIEALKPSNTGWLIADLVTDTWAFGWSRTAVDPALLALLADPHWLPVLVFPGEFADPARVIASLPAGCSLSDGATGPTTRRPLFVLLDGTWAEARKMFRKSPYLDGLPVLSLQPGHASNYRLRRSARSDHFCTAEVAALCLALAGDQRAADVLADWLDVFTAHYLSAKRGTPLDRHSPAHQRLQAMAKPPATMAPT
jgi:DTW domain-containing protein YfiP